MNNTGSCDTGINPSTANVGLNFGLVIGDVRVPAAGPFWPVSCNSVSLSQRYRPWSPHDGGAPLAEAGVTAWLHAPAKVRSGDDLHYVVTLANPGDQPVPLTPCPVYTQEFGNGPQVLTLNCAEAPASLPAHGSVSFAMTIAAGQFGAKTGLFELHWQIQEAGGPTAGISAKVKVIA
jgi:hypothetical protein